MLSFMLFVLLLVFLIAHVFLDSSNMVKCKVSLFCQGLIVLTFFPISVLGIKN